MLTSRVSIGAPGFSGKWRGVLIHCPVQEEDAITRFMMMVTSPLIRLGLDA